jgi:hypothetical protein
MPKRFAPGSRLLCAAVIRPSVLLVTAACSAFPAPSLASADALVAERISEGRYDALVVGGPDAEAGVGDYALSNGVVCAAIAAPEHETFVSPVGGTLIDLGLCGRANDQWSSLHALPDFDRERVLPISRVRVEAGDGEARAISEGEGDGIRVRIVHALRRAQPHTLSVTTELTRLPGSPRVFGFAELAMHASAQLRSFHLVRGDLARSQGFVHPGGNSLWTGLDMLAPSDVHVLVGAEGLPEVSYALELKAARARSASGVVRPLPAFSVTAEDFTLTAVVPRDFWLGGENLGLLEVLQVPLMSLAEGETLVLERAIHVGARSDVASALDELFADGAPVRGRVDDPRARIHFATATGAPVSQVRPDPEGRFALRLPPGTYQVLAVAPGGRERRRELVVGGSGATLAPIAVGAPATLTLPRDQIMRLVFVGLGDTPSPHFEDDGLGFRVGDGKLRKGDADNVVSLASAETDPSEVALAPGRYRVLATRGLEYDVTQREITLAAGETRSLEMAAPRRALASEGWIAADLHVHSAESMDAALPLPQQLAAFAAHGGEVLVSTEHDRVVDARPLIARLGLADRIASVVGAEVTGTYHGGETPFTIGHLNAFPLKPRRTANRGGAPRSEGVRVRGVVREVREAGGAPFVQINHPRESEPGKVGDGAFFSHLGVVGEPFDPTAPLASERNRSLIEPGAGGLRDVDFAGIEVLNGKRIDRYPLARADWLSLLLQGERRTATANSDSHSRGEVVAVPRNYVAVARDEVASFDESELLAALRAGRSFGTSGPLVFARLGEAGPGEIFVGSAGELAVEVRAAPWVPVRDVRVYVDAALAVKRVIRAGERAAFPLRFARDAFVFVEVSGAAEGVYRDLLPGNRPFAFTNAILVDANGDGRWQAPGLPSPVPALLSDPLASE